MRDCFRSYEQAITFLRERRHKDRLYRVLSQQGQDIRDQIVALTYDRQEIKDGTCAVAHRQWNTDICIFHPDDTRTVTTWDSSSTRSRFAHMNLPSIASAGSVFGQHRVHLLEHPTARLMIPGFKYGVPDGTYRLTADNRLDPREPEPVDTLYVPRQEALKAYALARRRLLKVLRDYVRVVEPFVGHGDPYYWTAIELLDETVDLLLETPTKGRCEGFLNQLLVPNGPLKPDTVWDYLNYIEEHARATNQMERRQLWDKKQVPSRDLEKYL